MVLTVTDPNDFNDRVQTTNLVFAIRCLPPRTQHICNTPYLTY
nr:C567 [uncultured bacterium]